MSVTRIRVKERDAIIQSLKSGVTPRIGIQHIQVGRVNEITALHQDIERIADGGGTTAAWRLQIENRPGSSCCCRTPRRICML
ncbi:hypothetical protein L433_10646 [Klebsiella pneumoniae BIDMC 7A]|nr:hypothetical protein L434_10198 [Klebsiella pneumoniae BIDMC 7B]EWF19289.1 hypothetical protein L405_05102 [Klebsiella pneumoniae BWH 36]EWF95710.1 hypothetical protein L433_10646 [Klebsiella pneumoniae BIDMC 7A]